MMKQTDLQISSNNQDNPLSGGEKKKYSPPFLSVIMVNQQTEGKPAYTSEAGGSKGFS